MRLGGSGLLRPALLLGGTTFLLALIALVLGVRSRGDSYQQGQESGAGNVRYLHRCSFLAASYNVLRFQPFGPAPIMIQNAGVSRETPDELYRLMLSATLTPGYEALHR